MTVDSILTAREHAVLPGPHVALYLRVSTEEQDVHHQRAHCYATAEREFPGVPVVEYEDAGVSASKTDLTERAASARMIAAIADGEVVGIVTWAQDRLSRRGSAEISGFLDYCSKHNVRIESATEGELHHDDMTGEVVSALRSVMAKYESISKGNRSKSGQMALAHAGKWPKGPTPPGYSRDATKALVPNETAPYVIEAFDRFDRGRSRNAIAAWLTDTDDTAWSRTRLVDVLRNPAYIGRIVHGGEDHPGLHQPLVSVELFERVQARLNEAAGFDMRKNRRSPFGAMFRCGCGSQMLHHSERRRGLDHHDYECKAKDCRQRVHAEAVDLNYAVLMQTTSSYVHVCLLDPEWRTEADPNEEQSLREELADLEQQRRYLMPLVGKGDTIAAEAAEEAHQRAETVQRELNQLTTSWESKRDMLRRLDTTWDGFHWTDATVDERRAVVVATTESIRAEKLGEGHSLLHVKPLGFPVEFSVPMFREQRGEAHRHARRVGYGVPITAASPS